MAHKAPLIPARDIKSRLFVQIFSDRKNLLELYNAVSKRNYQNPELLTINTLDNAVYMSMANDVSFIIDARMSLYEHQSTYNPNMPLRFLMYLSDLYSSWTLGKNLYGTALVQIPTPTFFVFYNGSAMKPDHQELRLSDAYFIKEQDLSLELKVDMLNVNAGHNLKLMESCKPLRDYAEYVRQVRLYAEQMPIEAAVEHAITTCIQNGILKEFLEKNRAEAKLVSIYEYNQEEHMRMEREEFFERGRLAGIQEEKQHADEKIQALHEEKQHADEEIRAPHKEKQHADEEIRALREELERLKKDLRKITS